MDTAISNIALDLAMAWGPDWLKPTQPRLKALRPELSDQQLDEYDKLARAVMSFGNGYLYDNPSCQRDAFAKLVLGRFDWVNAENMARLHSQGQYYAMK